MRINSVESHQYTINSQLQHSSINLPSLIIDCTYSFASPADRPPCFSAANAMASLTAAGILFEDLRSQSVSIAQTTSVQKSKKSHIPGNEHPSLMFFHKLPDLLRVLTNEILDVRPLLSFRAISGECSSVLELLFLGVSLPL